MVMSKITLPVLMKKSLVLMWSAWSTESSALEVGSGRKYEENTEALEEMQEHTDWAECETNTLISYAGVHGDS